MIFSSVVDASVCECVPCFCKRYSRCYLENFITIIIISLRFSDSLSISLSLSPSRLRRCSTSNPIQFIGVPHILVFELLSSNFHVIHPFLVSIKCNFCAHFLFLSWIFLKIKRNNREKKSNKHREYIHK